MQPFIQLLIPKQYIYSLKDCQRFFSHTFKKKDFNINLFLSNHKPLTEKEESALGCDEVLDSGEVAGAGVHNLSARGVQSVVEGPESSF